MTATAEATLPAEVPTSGPVTVSKVVKLSPEEMAAVGGHFLEPRSIEWRPYGSWGIKGASPLSLSALSDGTVRVAIHVACTNAHLLRPDPGPASARMEQYARQELTGSPELLAYQKASQELGEARALLADAQRDLAALALAREQLAATLPEGLAARIDENKSKQADARARHGELSRRVDLLDGAKGRARGALMMLLQKVEMTALQSLRAKAQQELKVAIADFVNEQAGAIEGLCRLSLARNARPALSEMIESLMGR